MTANEANVLAHSRIGLPPGFNDEMARVRATIYAAADKGQMTCDASRLFIAASDKVVATLQEDGYRVEIRPGRGSPLAHPHGVYQINWDNY